MWRLKLLRRFARSFFQVSGRRWGGRRFSRVCQPPSYHDRLQASARNRLSSLSQVRERRREGGSRRSKDPRALEFCMLGCFCFNSKLTFSLLILLLFVGKPAAVRTCLNAVFPAVPYCIDLIGGPRLEGNDDVVKVFRPKKKQWC